MPSKQRSVVSAASWTVAPRTLNLSPRLLKVPARSATVVLVLLSCLLMMVPIAQAQPSDSATGVWVGQFEQGSTVTNFQMSLVQNTDGTVSGTDFAQSNTQILDWAFWSVTGQVSNGKLTFQEGSITSQAAGTSWCTKSGQLAFSSSGTTLTGNWQAPGCTPGTISISNVPSPVYAAAGVWLGEAAQPAGSFFGYCRNYIYNLTQSASGALTGTRSSVGTTCGQPLYFVVWSVTGQVSGTALTLQDVAILSQNPPPNEPWCQESYQYTFTPDGTSYAGTGQSSVPGCLGLGSVILNKAPTTVYLPVVLNSVAGSGW